MFSKFVHTDFPNTCKRFISYWSCFLVHEILAKRRKDSLPPKKQVPRRNRRRQKGEPEDQQILGTIVENLVPTATWLPGFLYVNAHHTITETDCVSLPVLRYLRQTESLMASSHPSRETVTGQSNSVHSLKPKFL